MSFKWGMALSLSQHAQPVAEFEKTPKPKKRSFAQVVANKPVSLMHEHIIAPAIDDEQPLSTFQSRIWRPSRSPGALLLDISAVPKLTDQQHLETLVTQHPEVYGVRFFSNNSRKYLEAYCETSAHRQDLQEKGVVYQDIKLRLLPCPALEDGVTVIKVSLSDLPMLPRAQVLAGLTTSLSPFGRVVDVGITTEPTTGVFMGSGYANIHIPTGNPDEQQPVQFAALAHTISWCESKKETFYATWINMPTWCRYCHEVGHTKYNCEKSKARTICYECHNQGHRSADCSRQNAGKGKKRKTSQRKDRTLEATLSLPTQSPKTMHQEIQETGPSNQTILDMDFTPGNYSEKDDDTYIPENRSDSEEEEPAALMADELDALMDDQSPSDLLMSASTHTDNSIERSKEAFTAIQNSPHINPSRRTSTHPNNGASGDRLPVSNSDPGLTPPQ